MARWNIKVAIMGMDVIAELLHLIGSGSASRMQYHGVFAIGKKAPKVKASVMADAARTESYAMQLEDLIPIPDGMVKRSTSGIPSSLGNK